MADNEALARRLSSAVSRAITNALAVPGTSGDHQDEQSNEEESSESMQSAPGRPSKTIPKALLENLLHLKVPISTIAKSLGVSRPTVYKAISESNIQYAKYSNIEPLQLQATVAAITDNHPMSGEVMIHGHLRSQGIHVQRRMLRNAIHVSEPLGPPSRALKTVKRRVYCVPFPNYLWHIDGDHKLIRWRIVLHHAIDGFSRMVVFASCSSNNRAETVYNLYYEAISKYGRPYRIRSDYGGENVDVWRDMIAAWGEDKRHVIVGSSVHNQRIERHNRSANEQELNVFKQEFYALEAEGILDPSNDTDIFCLHYVFLPRLNRNISQFTAAHNNHTVSSEGNYTPAQMFWMYGHLTNLNEYSDASWYGMDVQTLLNTPDIPRVQVPETRNPLNDETYQQLLHTVDPLSPIDCKELYRRTTELVGRYMSSTV